MNKALVIGSRGSKLALLQSQEVKNLLLNQFPDFDISIKIIKTIGDENLNSNISNIGGKAIFTEQIEDQILSHKIDLAVHSLKDLPSKLKKGLLYIGSLVREDVRDAFVSNNFSSVEDIPLGGIVATGSIRRKAQLLAIRPDLKIINLRGNVDTRLKKLDNSNWDGIIVAAAALHRLGLKSRIKEYLDLSHFIPAPCQGAIGIEIDSTRLNLINMLSTIIDKNTTIECKVERSLLNYMGGDCSLPLGCYAFINNEKIVLSGYLSKEDGSNKKIIKLDSHKLNCENLALELSKLLLNNQ